MDNTLPIDSADYMQGSPRPNLPQIGSGINGLANRLSAETLPSFFFKNDTSQLIILGNGLDLACGLKSRYSDFFNWYFHDFMDEGIGNSPSTQGQQVLRKIQESCGGLGSINNGQHTRLTFDNIEKVHSVWDYVFAYECTRNQPNEWKDVEAVIRKWVSNSYLQQIVGSLRNGRVPNVGYDNSGELGVCLAMVAYMFSKEYDVNAQIEDSQINEIMLKELSMFEDSFASYLESAVSPEYKTRACCLFDDLAGQDLEHISKVGDSPEHLSNSVLSFNYTQPFPLNQEHVNVAHKIHTYRNIHGSLEGGRIIFGIDSLADDGNNLLENKAVLPFTKTYRIMHNAEPSIQGLFDTGHISRRNGDCLDAIKIFGHSLGKADYSYFQAIFDQENLYSGDVVLVFYYRPYDGFRVEQYYQAVVNLLSRYADTLDNPAHGKNLIHKLILEDRLSVRELEG
ncbi:MULTISPECIES: AbiH family protein [Bifidobacterium]|jgi:hypothetical protein|nr:AbiH family protein [Bifidobacterium tibiigranuli]